MAFLDRPSPSRGAGKNVCETVVAVVAIVGIATSAVSVKRIIMNMDTPALARAKMNGGD
jgi:hypothetical protein